MRILDIFDPRTLFSGHTPRRAWKKSIEPVRYWCTMVDRVIVVTPRCLGSVTVWVCEIGVLIIRYLSHSATKAEVLLKRILDTSWILYMNLSTYECMYRSIYRHVYFRTLLHQRVHALRGLEVDSWSWLPHIEANDRIEALWYQIT